MNMVINPSDLNLDKFALPMSLTLNTLYSQNVLLSLIEYEWMEAVEILI